MPQKKKKSRAERRPLEDLCTFCALPESKVDLLIKSGTDQSPANICDCCIGVAAQALNDFHRERWDLECLF